MEESLDHHILSHHVTGAPPQLSHFPRVTEEVYGWLASPTSAFKLNFDATILNSGVGVIAIVCD